MRPETARRLLGSSPGDADSVVLLGPHGALRRSRAVAALLQRMGGLWRLAGTALELVPPDLADGGYDLVARMRRHLGRRPPTQCPRVPDGLQDRLAH